MARRTPRLRLDNPGLPLHVRILLGIRATRHWTQSDLSEALSVSVRTIRRWESQRTAPHPLWMAAIRKLLAETEAMSALDDPLDQD